MFPVPIRLSQCRLRNNREFFFRNIVTNRSYVSFPNIFHCLSSAPHILNIRTFPCRLCRTKCRIQIITFLKNSFHFNIRVLFFIPFYHLFHIRLISRHFLFSPIPNAQSCFPCTFRIVALSTSKKQRYDQRRNQHHRNLFHTFLLSFI